MLYASNYPFKLKSDVLFYPNERGRAISCSRPQRRRFMKSAITIGAKIIPVDVEYEDRI
jgi:hypothetical protein